MFGGICFFFQDLRMSEDSFLERANTMCPSKISSAHGFSFSLFDLYSTEYLNIIFIASKSLSNSIFSFSKSKNSMLVF